jgi:hypothetical protein
MFKNYSKLSVSDKCLPIVMAFVALSIAYVLTMIIMPPQWLQKAWTSPHVAKAEIYFLYVLLIGMIGSAIAVEKYLVLYLMIRLSLHEAKSGS